MYRETAPEVKFHTSAASNGIIAILKLWRQQWHCQAAEAVIEE